MTQALLYCVLAGAAVLQGGGADSVTFDDARSVEGWTFSHGPEFPGASGRIAWSARDGRAAPGCLALHHDFSGGGRYVEATCPTPPGRDVGAVRLWLRKPAGHSVVFRATDSGGQTFQKVLRYAYDGWQQVEVDLRGWETFWGGAADGVVRVPLRRFGILVENMAEPRAGALLVDDVEFPARSAPGGGGVCTYVASDFAGPPGWWAAGGAGNRLDGGAWTFAFNAGEPPALRSQFSLLGKPWTLRLVLQSDAAGVTLAAAIASHFKRFDRALGTLTGAGEQIIEVPLGDMKTWRHSGWADATVEWPLRLLELRLERGGGPAGGLIRLRRLEVDTILPPGMDVLVLPDGRLEADQACFTASLQNLSGQPLQGEVRCRFRCLSETVGEEVRPLALPAGGGRQTVEFRRPLQGRTLLEAAFQWVGPDRASTPVSIGVALPPDDAGSSALEPASPIGMGLYLYRFFGVPQPAEMLTRVAALARQAGVKWTREEFNWSLIEPQRGQFNWAFYDQMVDVARAHGISVYGLLAYWSPWTKPNTPEGIDDYCRWARQVVRRYKGRVSHWEVWNEPNIAFWTGPRELYATLLTRAYEAIKAEDPRAVVLGCSTAGIDREFIRKTMELGGRFDALTIHPYRGALDEAAYMRELAEVRAQAGGREVWITEIGFPTQLFSGCDERTQAALVARTYLASVASGAVASISWYDFRNDGHDPFYNEENFGLVRADFRLKPAYRTFATLGRTLAGLRFGQRIEAGGDLFAARFTGPARDAVAVWSPSRSTLLACRADDAATFTDAAGIRIAPARMADDLVVTLDAGFPVYVSGGPGFRFEAIRAVHPVRLSRHHVHPGDTISVQVERGYDVADWQLPPGWAVPARRDGGVSDLVVPPGTAPGPVEFQILLQGSPGARVPLQVWVEPQVLRL